MEKFESLESNLNTTKNIIDKKVKELKKIKDKVSFNIKKQEIEGQLEEYSELLDLLEMEILEGTPTQRQEFEPKYEAFKNHQNEVELTVESAEAKLKKKLQSSKQSDLETEKVTLKAGGQEKKLEQMELEELDQHMKAKIDEADQDLDEIIRTLAKTKNLGKEIIIEIKRQQERLGLIKDTVNECYSLSKRSAKLLNYFKKNFMTDKIICVFIILICIAIIVIIGLRIAGFETDKFDPSVIPNQATDAATTSTTAAT